MSDGHGNTPAAWTAVTLALLGFLVGSIGLMAGSMLTFWIGVALVPLAGLAGLVMSRMGLGGTPMHEQGHTPQHDQA